MQTDYLVVLTLVFGFLMLLIQRTERKYRLWVMIIIGLTAGVIFRNLVINRGVEDEANLALFIAFIVNVLFWGFIGRYNPVGESDKNIQVLGMDD